jgi:hypothetical protein
MWIYKLSEPGLWTVGLQLGDDARDFTPESDHDSKQKAAARVNYLNGGRSEMDRDEKLFWLSALICAGNNAHPGCSDDMEFVANTSVEMAAELLAHLDLQRSP